MRKLVCGAMLSLDGVMQAPGGPQEDPSHGFRFGGWSVPYWDDDSLGEFMGGMFAEPFELLLGRNTYEIFAAYWPHHDDIPIGKAFNATRKHVATRSRDPLTWRNSVAIHDAANDVARLKQLFGDGATPAALKLVESRTATTGVVMTRYRRDGAVRTGSFGPDLPGDAEPTAG